MSQGKHSAASRRGKTIIITIMLAAIAAAGVMVFVFLRNIGKDTPSRDFLDKLSPAQVEILENEPALLPFLSSGYDPHSLSIKVCEPLESKSGSIRRYSVDSSRGKAAAYVFPDDAIFWCESSYALNLAFDGATNGRHLLESDARSPLLVQNTEGSGDYGMLIQPPLAHTVHKSTQYVAADDSNGSAEVSGGEAAISFKRPAGSDAVADWWAYVTPNGLKEGRETLDWLYDCTVEKFGGDNRMTIDGYYYISPSEYIPSGDGYYYLNPAAYIPNKLARRSGSIDGQQIAAAMLDIQRENYRLEVNENGSSGFVPTKPLCGYLNEWYGLGAGFHDTRFNTELALALISLGRDLGIEEFVADGEGYVSFLVDHALTRSYETENGGILVDDYSHPDGCDRTHSALNHQLAEILLLYLSDSDEAHTVADRMLLGVEDTADEWIMPDGNLHYAYYPDGSFGGSDYPYLTYNDLLALDEYLGGNEAMERLMEAKRSWMDANGITDYNK